MALGKPVVTYLKQDVVERSAAGYGVRIPIVPATKETLVEALRPLVEQPALRREIGAASRAYVEQVHDIDRVTDRLLDRLPFALELMSLAFQMRRLARHSAIYGIGGLVSRILATILLPLYTHYLPPGAFGRVEIVTAATAVLAIVLQLGIASAFFRFYFDEKEDAGKLTVVRTSFWFTMAMATLGLVVGVVFANPIGHLIGLGHDPWLVRAGAVGLWAQTNYQQLTNLFRAEERSTAFAIASVTNVLVTVVAMVVFVAVFHWGAIGLVVGNFTGTLVVYVALVALPHGATRARVRSHAVSSHAALRDAARAVGARAVGDQLHRSRVRRLVQGQDRGRHLLGRREDRLGDHLRDDRVPHGVAGVRVLDRGRPRGEACVRVRAHLPARVCVVDRARPRWARTVVDASSHRQLDVLSAPRRASRCSRSPARSTPGYTVLAIGSGRARKTQLNWVVTGVGAAVEHRPQLLADPEVRDGRRGDLDARRVRRAVRRDDDLRPARLPGLLPVAARRSPQSVSLLR